MEVEGGGSKARSWKWRRQQMGGENRRHTGCWLLCDSTSLLGWLGRQPSILDNLCAWVYCGTWGIGFAPAHNVGPQRNSIARSST